MVWWCVLVVGARWGLWRIGGWCSWLQWRVAKSTNVVYGSLDCHFAALLRWHMWGRALGCARRLGVEAAIGAGAVAMLPPLRTLTSAHAARPRPHRRAILQEMAPAGSAGKGSSRSGSRQVSLPLRGTRSNQGEAASAANEEGEQADSQPAAEEEKAPPPPPPAPLINLMDFDLEGQQGQQAQQGLGSPEAAGRGGQSPDPMRDLEVSSHTQFEGWKCWRCLAGKQRCELWFSGGEGKGRDDCSARGLCCAPILPAAVHMPCMCCALVLLAAVHMSTLCCALVVLAAAHRPASARLGCWCRATPRASPTRL